MKFNESDFFKEVQNLFSKYVDKFFLNKLMLNISKVYEEFETPSRFRSHNANFEELQELKNSLNMINLNTKLLEEILLSLEEVGEKIFLNQYELKLINAIKTHLKEEKKLKEFEVDTSGFENKKAIEEVNVVSLIENFSNILKALNDDEKIKKVDEKRAKEYDKMLYKKVDKIRYI